MNRDDLLVDLVNGLLPAVPIEGRMQPMNIHDRMEHHRVPGVSLALGDTSGMATFALGSSDHRRPMAETTRLQAASAGKAIAAFLSLMMVEEGLLPLDSDVRPLLKRWKPRTSDAFTLRQLASHTAGFNVHGFDGYPQGEVLPTLAQILGGEAPAKSPAIEQIRSPGSRFSYSGGGYTVLELLVEDVSGRSFESLVADYVFGPLSMEASGFWPVPPHDIAAGFDADGKRVPGGHLIYPQRAAAGLWTTPGDLVKFCNGVRESIAGRGILSAELASLFVESQDDLDIMNFGFFNGPGGWIEHGGANAGFRVQMWLCGHQAFAVMSNGDGGTLLNREILHGLAHMAGWNEILPVPAVPHRLEAPDADEFCGRYEFSSDSDLGIPGCEIAFRDGMLSWSDEDERLELIHVGDGAFIVPTHPGFRIVIDGSRLDLHIYEDTFRASRRGHD
ncbi:beta-lactamase family protein [Mycolicibacterium farcinogenes]|nr:beta-lactamase family protein [Mycolicibacterium farcinogenes]